MLSMAWWSLLSTFLLLFTRVTAQNLTDDQLAVISQRLAESALKSWELGTRTQTILELNVTRYSVFSHNPLPPPQLIPSNLTSLLTPFFSIPQDILIKQSNVTLSNTSIPVIGPKPLVIGDGSAADPASIGMSTLLANWTNGAADKSLDYASAARAQLDYLLSVVPRTTDGAISHRVSEVQLWSDFVYMVPPFLAYYAVMNGNRTLLLEAYNQIKLYRNYLRDPDAQSRWKHVLLGANGPSNDEGHWTTGNGWAAAGMLRVLATIRNSQYANSLKGQQKDLTNWVKEIHDGMYAVLDTSVNLWTNYPDIPPDSPGNFYDAAGTALLASTVFRGAVMLNQFTHVPAALKIRETLFSPSSSPITFSSSSSSSSTTPSSRSSSSTAVSISSSSFTNTSTSPTQKPTSSTISSSTTTTTQPEPTIIFLNYPHLTTTGWLTPVVNPDSFSVQGSQSPESEAFTVQLHSAWRDWVEDGSRGANSAQKLGPGRLMTLVLGVMGVWILL